MKKVSTMAFVLIAFFIANINASVINGNTLLQKVSHIKSVTAITEVFGEGQKLTAVAIQYDKDISNSGLSRSSFAVDGRTITNIYGSNALAKSAKGSDGRFVIIELSPADKGASLVSQVGSKFTRTEPIVSLKQVENIVSKDGQVYLPEALVLSNTKVINLIVDDFKQFEYTDTKTGISIKYNLFIPKNYTKNKTYPMVVFIHDAGVIGSDPYITLTQGNGAIVWATPTEQAKHECFVLAPQFSVTTTDNSDGVEATVRMINSIAEQYSIDKNRLYTTGQSMGCMLSIAMDIKYPDLFAASFLVAGQCDSSLVAPMASDKLWIIVAEGDRRAFPGMNQITAALENDGAKISRAKWDGQSTKEVFAAKVKEMLDEGKPIKYTVFEKLTTMPEDERQSGKNEHMETWKVAYNIEGVRDWLFAQSK